MKISPRTPSHEDILFPADFADWPGRNEGSRWQLGSEIFFNEKNTHWKETTEAFFNLKNSENFVIKTQVVRAFKEESQDMAIFDLAFGMKLHDMTSDRSCPMPWRL